MNDKIKFKDNALYAGALIAISVLVIQSYFSRSPSPLDVYQKISLIAFAYAIPGLSSWYCPRENPRLCRGGCQSLTFPGVCSSPFERVSLTSVQRHSLVPWPVAKRPLWGASNRKASGSAGGYLL